MSANEIRPRLGQVSHADGSTTPVMFEPDEENPHTFVAVHLDGSLVVITREEQLYVDVIGPGQAVRADIEDQAD